MAMQFSVEITDLTDKAVTVRIKKDYPEVKMGRTMMRGLAASALCERMEGLQYRDAFRMTDSKTEWRPETKTYEIWDWKSERVDLTTVLVTIQFPDESKQLFKKQPDGSYAASMSDLLSR